jgi:hypothetical protein
MSDETTLPGFDEPPQSGGNHPLFGEGATEMETRLAIAEIEASKPITGSRRTVKQLCLSLAKSIDRGNTKGRAIANEAAQLFAMMQVLEPAEEAAGDVSDLSPETQALFDLFSTRPQPPSAGPRETEEVDAA